MLLHFTNYSVGKSAQKVSFDNIKKCYLAKTKIHFISDIPCSNKSNIDKNKIYESLDETFLDIFQTLCTSVHVT